MMNDKFEWDARKASSNLRKHRVAFEDAQLVFNDFFAMHAFDADAGYREQRMLVTGMVNGVLLTVVYTERDERTRIISARKATNHERFEYYFRQTPR